MFISDQACLLRKAVSGEHYLLLVFFLKERGLLYVLTRQPKGRSASVQVPDLLQTGSVILEQKDPGKPAFLKDFTLQVPMDGLARSYKALQAASELARFYERNLLHMEHYEDTWPLLHKALEAMAEKPFPEATLLKTYFLFARTEGYPVLAHWLNRKKANDKAAITRVLQQPLESLEPAAGELRRWVDDLGDFFRKETDLLPPGQ